MKLLLDGKGPWYEQLARAIKSLILDGTLAPKSRLPSTRALAISLKMSRKSVLEAYDLLAAEQLISSRIGVGTLVAGLAIPRNTWIWFSTRTWSSVTKLRIPRY
jgi:GntR family transcriptional regulator/MocR family aminotransferase